MSKKYTTQEAVDLMKLWGISFTKGTLEVWRCRKEGPKFIKIRSKVFYTEDALREFAQGFEVKTVDSIFQEGRV